MPAVNVLGDSGVTIARPIIIMALALDIGRRIAKCWGVHITVGDTIWRQDE